MYSCTLVDDTSSTGLQNYVWNVCAPFLWEMDKIHKMWLKYALSQAKDAQGN